MTFKALLQKILAALASNPTLSDERLKQPNRRQGRVANRMSKSKQRWRRRAF